MSPEKSWKNEQWSDSSWATTAILQNQVSWPFQFLFPGFQAKDNNQSVCIVAEKQTLKEYKRFSAGAEAEPKTVPGETNGEVAGSSEAVREEVKGVVFKKVSTSKEAIAKACEQTFSHNLTICHVTVDNLQSGEDDGDDVGDKETEQPKSR